MNASLTKTAILCGAILFGTIGLDAGDQVKVRVSPHFSHAPADLVIYVTVEPNSLNRALRVSADSSDFFRSSETPLNGEASPRTTILRFRELPAGVYDVTADLIDQSGRRRAVAFGAFQVL